MIGVELSHLHGLPTESNLCSYPDRSERSLAQRQASPAPELKPKAANELTGDAMAEGREAGSEEVKMYEDVQGKCTGTYPWTYGSEFGSE
jgi:hypothetical protein